MGTIKIKGYATKEVNADIVNITISFTAKNAKVTDALEEVRKQSELFLKEIKSIGFDISKFHLDKDRSSEEGYGDNKTKSATRTMSYRTEFSPKIINTIISVITKNNLEASIETDYLCSNKEEIQKELLQEAIQNSRNNANVLAKANNQKVKYAELISDNKDDYYDKEDWTKTKCGDVCGIELDDELLSNDLVAKKIRHSETVYVTWVIE